MRFGSFCLAAACAVFVTGCVRIVPNWEFKPDLDLSGHETFSIAPAATPNGLSPDDRRTWEHRRWLVASLVQQELVAKGYRVVDADPDFLVKLYVAIYQKDGFTHQEHQFRGKVDVVAADPETKMWLWHAWAEETITSSLDHDAELRQAVPMLLEKFPPRPSGE